MPTVEVATSGDTGGSTEDAFKLTTTAWVGNTITPIIPYKINEIELYVGTETGDVSAIDFIAEVWTLKSDLFTPDVKEGSTSNIKTGLTANSWNLFTFTSTITIDLSATYGYILLIRRDDFSFSATNYVALPFGDIDWTGETKSEVARLVRGDDGAYTVDSVHATNEYTIRWNAEQYALADAETGNKTQFDTFHWEDGGTLSATTGSKERGSYGYFCDWDGSAGNNGIAARIAGPSVDEMYCAMWIYIDSGFVGAANDDFTALRLLAGGSMRNALQVRLNGSGVPYTWNFNGRGSGNGDNDTRFSMNEWHHLETYTKKGTGSNSEHKFWVDGLLLLDQIDGDSTITVERCHFGAYSIGGVISGSFIYFDECILSVTRIGTQYYFPVIVIIDAETGDVTQFNSVSGDAAPTAETNAKNTGTYGFEILWSGASERGYGVKNFPALSDNAFVSIDIYIPSGFDWGSVPDLTFIRLGARVEARLQYVAGEPVVWRFKVAGTGTFENSSVNFSLDTWHTVELEWVEGTGSDGGGRMWVDGVLAVEILDSNETSVTISTLDAGSRFNIQPDNGTYLYFDNVIVSAERIGQDVAPLEQEGFRFRNDDGSDETDATWRQTQDTNDTIAINNNFRLRVLIDALGNPDSSAYQLEYKETGDATSEYRKVKT